MPISSAIRFFVIVVPSGGYSNARYQGGCEDTTIFVHRPSLSGATGHAAKQRLRIREAEARNEIAKLRHRDPSVTADIDGA
jgi:hypothetical protein